MTVVMSLLISYSFSGQNSTAIPYFFQFIIGKTIVCFHSCTVEQGLLFLDSHKLISKDFFLRLIPKDLFCLQALVLDEILDLDISFTPIKVFIPDEKTPIRSHGRLKQSINCKKFDFYPFQKLQVAIFELQLAWSLNF